MIKIPSYYEFVKLYCRVWDNGEPRKFTEIELKKIKYYSDIYQKTIEEGYELKLVKFRRGGSKYIWFKPGHSFKNPLTPEECYEKV
jgi:hypothetical protein